MPRRIGDRRQVLMGLVMAVGLSGHGLTNVGRTTPGSLPGRTGADADDSTAVVQLVARFHKALEEADSAAALALLAGDAVILESGDRETREEYRAHHLASDIAFTRAVPDHPGPRRAVVLGEAAWVTSTGVSQGSYRGRTIDAATAELMVLSRKDEGWVIRAIHWSSHSRIPR